MPSGCIFGSKGPAVIVQDNDHEELLALLAISNSQAFRSLVEFQLAAADAQLGGAARSYEVGVIQRTPLPPLTPPDQRGLAALARSAWLLRRSVDTRNEVSHAFTLPALLQVSGARLTERAAAWDGRARGVDQEVVAIVADVETRCFELYGINDADRRTIIEGFGAADVQQESDAPVADFEDDCDEEDGDVDAVPLDGTGLVAELVSWAVGVAFGRFDVRLATGARSLPAEPEPFDPLPAYSPGRLTDDGLPLIAAPVDYPLSIPGDGVLVDDPGHPRDLTKAVRAVFDKVFGVDAEARWHESVELLDARHRDLRTWLTNSFFEHHQKRYSKSRRKAPIVWQLSTPSSSYSVWLYAHRVTSDTFFHVQRELVEHKLNHEERKHGELVEEAGPNPNARDRKAISTQSDFVAELRTMLSEVKRVTPLWRPDLDDGVVLTMAPLWRLVPQHRAWQRELKTAWDALRAGEYDWAHVAMHLWPERVVPNCTTDRSIAIAHDLEEVFWVRDLDDEWRRLQDPSAEREYVASQWAGSERARLAKQARGLWEARYRDAGRDDSGWWQALKDGGHEDHPLSIWLWPRRVCQRALSDSGIADAHKLRLPKPTGTEKWLEGMATRYRVSDEDRAFLAEAFSKPVGAPSWKAWWSQLAEGRLDHLPIARHLRPHDVATGCETSIELAEAHGVTRFFYVDRGHGTRPRLTQAEEQSREVATRTSPAVKAALASLLEAPAVRGVR
jgi:hypothetical protein